MPDDLAADRRRFLQAALGTAALTPWLGRSSQAAPLPVPAPSLAADPWRGLKVGIATYTFSKIPLDKTIQGVSKLGVGYVSIKESHLPLKSSTDERKNVVAKFKAAGIIPLSCGVVTFNDEPSDQRNVFEYARDAGLPVIVCKPTRKSLPALQTLVKEFDIKLAIHNHGPEDKVWPSPYDAWEAVQTLDPRIGLCIDVGHTKRSGVDPAEAIRKCSERLYDLHIKDIEDPAGRSRPTEIGRGILDIRGILKALLDTKYGYHVGLEFEKDLTDPMHGSAESLGYLKGMLAGGV